MAKRLEATDKMLQMQVGCTNERRKQMYEEAMVLVVQECDAPANTLEQLEIWIGFIMNKSKEHMV